MDTYGHLFLDRKRRARDSNPQPANRHLISNQTPEFENTEQNAHSQQGAAQGAAVGAENASIDPGLQTIVERWPGLPDALKAGILAMVQAVSSDTES